MPATIWTTLRLHDAVLREQVAHESRLVLWLPDGRDRTFQYWIRLSTADTAEAVIDNGLAVLSGTAIRARQRLNGLFRNALAAFRTAGPEQIWFLPNGATAVQSGDRETDIVLARALDDNRLDEAGIKARWPESKRVEEIGDGLFVVTGVEEFRRLAQSGTAEETGGARPVGCPRAEGERLLASARARGDSRCEAAALADLGIMSLSEGDARGGLARLEEALALVRRLGERTAAADILGHMGLALLQLDQPQRARQLFERGLAQARQAGDRFEEKAALERLGVAYARQGDPARARAFFELALGMARNLGDRQHQADLLWHLAVQHAELGERVLAIAKGEAAVTLLEQLAKPQARVFAGQLEQYRQSGSIPPGGRVRPVSAQQAFDVGHGAAGPRPDTPYGNAGPGILRMAWSAAEALAKFAAARFKTVSAETRRRRLQTCAGCSHHTGLRCKVCGCFTEIKARLPHEECPVGNWPA